MIDNSESKIKKDLITFFENNQFYYDDSIINYHSKEIYNIKNSISAFINKNFKFSFDATSRINIATLAIINDHIRFDFFQDNLYIANSVGWPLSEEYYLIYEEDLYFDNIDYFSINEISSSFFNNKNIEQLKECNNFLNNYLKKEISILKNNYNKEILDSYQIIENIRNIFCYFSRSKDRLELPFEREIIYTPIDIYNILLEKTYKKSNSIIDFHCLTEDFPFFQYLDNIKNSSLSKKNIENKKNDM